MNPRSKKKPEPTFGEALAEVEGILERLENDEVDIDELSAEVRRAAELIQLCRTKLERTETEVREFVAALEAPEEPAVPAVDDGGDTTATEPTDGTDDTTLPF